MAPKKAKEVDGKKAAKEPMVYVVTWRHGVERNLEKLPEEVQTWARLLVDDLREHGPLRNNWPNYSPLSNNFYHCHLTRKYVAVWEWSKGSIKIQIDSISSREGASYKKKKS